MPHMSHMAGSAALFSERIDINLPTSCQLGGVENLGSRANLRGQEVSLMQLRLEVFFSELRGALEGEASLTGSLSWLGRDVPKSM